MIPDDQLIPICRKWAKRLKHLAKHLGSAADVIDELTNEAYQTAKSLDSIRLVHKTVMWRIIEFADKTSRAMDDKRLHQHTIYQEQPIEELIEKEDLIRLRAAMRKLHLSELKLIEAYFWDNKTFDDIARKARASKGSIWYKMQKVLTKLRREVEKNGK